MNEERKQEIMEFACEIIGIFEHLLDEKGISIPCADTSDQEERLENEEAGRIYGSEYYSLEDDIMEAIEKYLEKEDSPEDKILVLDRRSNENPTPDHGDLVFCSNCGLTIFMNTGNVNKRTCPECDERSLTWADEDHKTVSEKFFHKNKEYLLCDTEC